MLPSIRSRWPALLLALSCGAVVTLDGQTLEKAKEMLELKDQLQQGAQGAVVSTLDAPILDGTIDADTYTLGPSDKLAINLWLVPPVSYTLTVTPEAKLIIPTVGEISVDGLTLAAAREKVIRAVREKYFQGTVSVSLLSPRRVLVSISGEVSQPGRWDMSASDRVDRLVSGASKALPVVKTDELLDLTPELSKVRKASRRNILLRHRDGTKVTVDLDLFDATGDPSYNPRLREGDDVFVPRFNDRYDAVAIYGGIQSPGVYEFVAGDRLGTLVTIARGLRPSSASDSLLLYRYREDEHGLTVIRANLDAILAGKSTDIALQAGDRVVVPQRRKARPDAHVVVEGEVASPGTFPIDPSGERLTDVIRRAGGFTLNASLGSAEIIHPLPSMNDVMAEQLRSQRGITDAEDTSSYRIETTLRIGRGNAAADFVRLFALGDTTADVVLKPGDRIVVPASSGTVYVLGQVQRAGSLPFQRGVSVMEYVHRAGGLAEGARSDDIMVIKHGTRQWVQPGQGDVEEGDLIWVPKEPYRPFTYYLTVASQTASVLSVILSMVFIIVTVK